MSSSGVDKKRRRPAEKQVDRLSASRRQKPANASCPAPNGWELQQQLEDWALPYLSKAELVIMMQLDHRHLHIASDPKLEPWSYFCAIVPEDPTSAQILKLVLQTQIVLQLPRFSNLRILRIDDRRFLPNFSVPRQLNTLASVYLRKEDDAVEWAHKELTMAAVEFSVEDFSVGYKEFCRNNLNHSLRDLILDSLPAQLIDFRRLPYLRTLSLNRSFVTVDLLKAISTCKVLQHLGLTNCICIHPCDQSSFSEEGKEEVVSALQEILRKCLQLQSIEFGGEDCNVFRREGVVETFAALLSGTICTNMQQVCVRGCHAAFGDGFLASLPEATPNLIELYVDDCVVTPACLVRVAKVLPLQVLSCARLLAARTASTTVVPVSYVTTVGAPLLFVDPLTSPGYYYTEARFCVEGAKALALALTKAKAVGFSGKSNHSSVESFLKHKSPTLKYFQCSPPDHRMPHIPILLGSWMQCCCDKLNFTTPCVLSAYAHQAQAEASSFRLLDTVRHLST